MKRIILFSTALLLPFLSVSCFRHAVIGFAKPIVAGIETSYYRESDIRLAEESLPSVIKITEGLHYYNPHSSYLNAKLCFLYGAYAFGYLDKTPYDDLEESFDEELQRLDSFYKKAQYYGELALARRLGVKTNELMRLLREPENFAAKLARLGKRDSELLFWFAFSKALLAFNNTGSAAVMLEFGSLVKIVDHLIETDPRFLYGSSYALRIAVYGGRGEAIGGDMKKAAEAYRQALRIGRGKSLIPGFVYMKYVTPILGDVEQFDKIGEALTAFNAEEFPDFIFINKVIQAKTKALLLKKDLLF